MGLYSTDAAANTALLSFLNDQYDGGAAAGEFVFIRMSVDDADSLGTNVRYNITANEGAILANDSSIAPTIIFTAVPEPGTSLLAGAATLLLSLRRKRR